MAKKPRATVKKGAKSAKPAKSVKLAAKAKSGKAKTDQAKQPSGVARALIPAKDVKYLARYANEMKNKVGNITSTLGQEIKTYAEKGLDPAAFQAALKQLRLGMRDPVRLRAFRDNLTYYLDVLEVEKYEATDLFEDKPAKARAKKKDNGAKPVETEGQTEAFPDFAADVPVEAPLAEATAEDQQFH